MAMAANTAAQAGEAADHGGLLEKTARGMRWSELWDRRAAAKPACDESGSGADELRRTRDERRLRLALAARRRPRRGET